jgi:DNA-binding transcriptional regulator YdaS (Cro superfamily)
VKKATSRYGQVKQAKHGEQTELAKLLGVPKHRVNHWIAGRKIPNRQRRAETPGISGEAAQDEVSRAALKDRVNNPEL